MPYTPQTWHNSPATDTPISATRLGVMEGGISAAQTTYNVKAYGAAGDGSTNDTTAIQSAITAAVATHGTVFIPTGTYKLTATLTVTDYCQIVGDGWASVLQLANGVNDFAVSFSTASGIVGAQIRDLTIDGNGANQTAGGGIYAQGAVQCVFDRVHFIRPYDVSLWLYQIGAGNLGHHNRVTRCLFDQGNVSAGQGQGIRMQSSDENLVAFCDFENWGGTGPGSEPYAIKDWSGIQQIISNVFVSGHEAVRLQDISSTRVIGNTFDGVGRAGVHASGSKNVIIGNLFSNGSSDSTGAYAQCEIDNSSSATIVGNSFTVTTSGVVRNCVYELSSSSDNTMIQGNTIDLTGGSLFGGNPSIQLNGAHSFVLGIAAGLQVGHGSSEPLGFYGATPITRPNTTGTTTGFTAGSGTTVVSGSTFTGNTGATAYTIGDVVNALKRLGLLAP